MHGLVDTGAVVEVHVGGAVDDDEFLLGRGGLGVELLAVPQRACLAAGDDQERLGQQRVDCGRSR